MSLADVAGWLGATALLAAYAANALGRMPAQTRSYQLANLLGSVGLAAVASAHRAWPSVTVNVLWIAVSGAAMARRAGSGLELDRHGRRTARSEDVTAPGPR
jgi:hypothetical protein